MTNQSWAEEAAREVFTTWFEKACSLFSFEGEATFNEDDADVLEVQIEKALLSAYERGLIEAARVAWNHEPDFCGPIETAILALLKEGKSEKR